MERACREVGPLCFCCSFPPPTDDDVKHDDTTSTTNHEEENWNHRVTEAQRTHRGWV